MYRLARLTPARPYRLSRGLCASLPTLTTPSSQGHATRKSSDPSHKNKDVQSASVTAAAESKASSRSGSGKGHGADQPFDAARQGGSGGESKRGSEGRGPGKGWEGSMKDQVGGQRGGASRKGGKEGAAGESIPETIANKVRGLHTSASVMWPTSPGSIPDGRVEGNAQPTENLRGEQNEHLKHKGADEADNGAGNAASDPHLPSQQKKEGNAVKRSDGSKRRLHSSARSAMPTKQSGGYAQAMDSEPKTTSGYNVPQEALPPQLDSAYSKEAAPPAEEDMIPSSDMPHSSTAVDPPNETLRQQALSGGLKERNPQPKSEFGRKGIDEAWKNRGI